MKAKLLQLPSLCKIAAGLLSVIAFFCMFGDQVRTTNEGISYSFSFYYVLFGADGIKGAVIPFIAYLLILFAGAGSIALVFVETKYSKVITYVIAAVLFVSAVLLFFTTTIFLGVNNSSGSDFFDYYDAAAPVLAGIFALLGAAGNVCSLFAKGKLEVSVVK